MRVKAEVSIQETDGEETKIGEAKQMTVQSHWNYHGHDGLVVLTIPGLDGTISVSAAHLIKAVELCHNLPR